MEIKTIPLLDNYETTLSQEWNGQIWKMKVDDLPNIPVDSSGKFVDWFTTYVIVNPDKNNFQLAEIDGYNSQEKTLNVISVNLEKWLKVPYNFSHHNQKSIVRISNNFAFWKKIAEVLNSKQDYGIWTIKDDYFLNVENGVLKFKDKDNTEITLTDIAWKIWQDKKVSIDGTDTAKFLQEKIWKWLKVDWTWENKKVIVDFINIDFSWIWNKNFSEDIEFLTSDNKKIDFKTLNASYEEINSLWNTKKNVTVENLKNFFENNTFSQIAYPSNTLRLFSDREETHNWYSFWYRNFVKNILLNFSWKIKVSFDFRLQNMAVEWVKLDLVILRKLNWQTSRDINNPTFEEKDVEKNIFSINFWSLDFNTKNIYHNWQTKWIENIEVQKWDKIAIFINWSTSILVKNFRIYFDMKKADFWEILK